ncbi:single-stranded DNA-binding protein [Streptococcus sp. E17BB]|uniref:single-stranded DNA-binding protein n=1 Tax=Streptococcus sp. E17BB TaxID=3278714 RepID=UPI00359EAAA6
MLNKVILTGRLTKSLELKKTPTGKSVASFTLAVERRQKSSSGEKITDFYDCVIWNTPAENLAAWTAKGSLIGVTGRLEKRSYQNQQGQRVVVTEVIVEELTLLEYKRQANTQEVTISEAPASVPAEQTSFFQGQTTNFVDD